MEIRENSIRACAERLPQGEGYLALSYVLDTTPGALRAKADSLLPPEALERYEAIVARRLHGEPLQYAIGQWEFYGHLFAVDRRALIPRPETERLVEIVLDEGVGGQVVADIGTGTGAIALSIALEAQPAPSVVYATDLSREALDLAKENAAALLQPARAGMVKWIEGDGPSVLPEAVDVLLSNPPYIDPMHKKNLQAELSYEPSSALFAGVAGKGGVALYEAWIPQLTTVLKPGGRVFFEIGDDQGEAVADLFRAEGFAEVAILQDYTGRDRMVRARRIV